MIDRITKSLLKDFQAKFSNFSSDLEEEDLFEHFVNYTILEKKLEERIDEECLDRINIGKNKTIGIDGFCILINKHLITSLDDLNDILCENNKPIAEIYFIQAKTENKFNIKNIGLFGDAIDDFVSEKQAYEWNENASESINLFKELINQSHKLENNPTCYMYYVTLGNYNNDNNTEAQKNKIINKIQEQRVFGNISFHYIDHNNIQNEYKKIDQKISKTFTFSNRTLLPEIDNVDEAYIGVIPVTTIIDLVEENGELISSIFYDNVRDFQGFNRINEEIKNTIEDNKLKYAFSILNNGITIVAEKMNSSRDNVTITNYQIINGLQTSRVLLEAKSELNIKMYVPLKLIITQDETLISKIIRSTNRQTEVKEEDLIAYSDFQKKLEDYFKTFEEPNKLFYERRSKQYNNSIVNSKYIIDKSTLIKVMGSFYFERPNQATRYFGALFKEFGNQLFKDNHRLSPYYTASLIYNKLENLFRNGSIDKKYRKIRYFILMMIRFEYKLRNGKDYDSLDSKKTENYCKELLLKLNDENEFIKYIEDIIEKIKSLDIDLNSLEISKSSGLVNQIKQLYL